jgi:ABC-type polysaccharide/polyol phosphate transport system ATPase subunit
VRDDTAISVEAVTKRFRRYAPVAPRSLKTTLVERLRGRAPRSAGDRLVLFRALDFEVARGACLGLVGRNGAGKSTLLKLIAGVYRPDAGRIATRGEVAALIELGAGFHPEFSGRENVFVNGMILRLSRQQVRERFDSIVAFSGIGDFIDAPVRTYSSGMLLRLAFSVAIHVDPDILLIDEILAVGDEPFQRRCREAIAARIASRARTTVIASHDMDLVTRFCDRVVVLDPPQARVFESAAAGVAHYRAGLDAAARRAGS